MKQNNRGLYAVVGVIVLLLVGLVYAWSVMAKSIGAAFPDWTQQQLSLTFTLTMTMFCVGCLVGGFMAKKVVPANYLRISGVLFLAGFLIAATAQTPIILYLGFGVLCGFASGLSYSAVMSTVSAWYPDKQGLISGVLLMGFGLSSFFVGKIFAAAAPADGSDAWRFVFRVFAVVICVILIVCSFLFRKPGPDFVPPAAAAKKQVREPATEMNTASMMRSVPFWLYYVWAVLISAVGLALVSQASGIASEVGTTVAGGTIATVVGLISILNGIGRVFFGTLFDKKGFRPTMLLCMVVFAVAAGILLAALKSGAFSLIVLGFVVGGFAYGAVTPTNSAIISDFFGRKNYPMNFSIINTNLIFASFASTIAGKLYDNTQSYNSTIIMMLGLTVVGFIVFLGIRRPKEK